MSLRGQSVRSSAALLILIIVNATAMTQGAGSQAATLRVEVRAAGAPVSAAEVNVNGQTVKTDSSGVASMAVPAGPSTVTIAKDGFLPAAATVSIAAGETQAVLVEMSAQPDEFVTVSATRTGAASRIPPCASRSWAPTNSRRRS